MEAIGFRSYVKHQSSPKTTSQWRRRWAQPISKLALLSYGSANVFTGSLAQSGVDSWWGDWGRRRP